MVKSKKKLQLTNHQKILGSRYCFENSKALYEEAEILLENSKWARSAALFILGIEEISKIELIGQTFFYKTAQEWADFEKKFFRHSTKLKMADIILLQLRYKTGNTSKLEEELNEIKKGRNLNIGKQKCFYIGFSIDNGWEVPLRDVTEEDANYCKEVLNYLIDAYSKVFSKSFNQVVDIIEEMKKIVPSAEAMRESNKMRDEIKKLSDEIDKKKHNQRFKLTANSLLTFI
jgi:AbiV family abortive infection protein